MRVESLSGLIAVLLSGILQAAASPPPEYISESPGLIVASSQSWGVPGLNVAAHQPNLQGQPLQIGTNVYPRGLGHHANGELVIALDGGYDRFQADIGIQPCTGGSVVFRVLTDGTLMFESPIIHAGDAPISVNIAIYGAQMLTLETDDAGDGISCDMANWCNARLIPGTNAVGRGAAQQAQRAGVDIAQFARVATWDVGRTNGAAASRIEEFRAEDLFAETELRTNLNGSFSIPAVDFGRETCIGLQWLEQRHLRELDLSLAGLGRLPESENSWVEAWFGESAWQGQWRRVPGEVATVDAKLVFMPDRKHPLQTRKIRWVLQGSAPGTEVRLSAFSRSQWLVTNILVQCESAMKGRGVVCAYNGELLFPSAPPGSVQSATKVAWDPGKSLRFDVRYSRTSFFSDPTLLRFELPGTHVSVAVADLLTNDCVYVPAAGLFVARDPTPIPLRQYKRRIAERKTILDHVREMPEQTLSQAMARTHRDYQRYGQVVLSLACDNSKFIVERDGVVRFSDKPYDWSKPYHEWPAAACQMQPQLGSGKSEIQRHLQEGWLPIPVISLTNGCVEYSQRTFVAPLNGGTHGLIPQKSICVVDFTATNHGNSQAAARIELNFLDHLKRPAQLNSSNSGLQLSAQVRDRVVARIESPTRPARFSEGAVAYQYTLSAGEGVNVTAYILPDSTEVTDLPQNTDRSRLLVWTEPYWQGLLSRGTQVETPDEWLNNLIRSSIVRCLIAGRNEADGRRIGASIAAMTYGPLESEAHSVIRGMDFLGQNEFAQRSLDYFIHRYNTNRFLTTGYTTFGTAWHLWTLGEHYALTRDTRWLSQAANEIGRVCDWVLRQTQKTKRLDPYGQEVPEFGLMPPGVLADWNAFAYHFAMNGYYAAALQHAGKALSDIHHPDAKRFLAGAEELRRNTLRAFSWTQARSPVLPLRDGSWVPYYPSQVHSPGKLAQFFPGQDAGRSWCYDVELGAHQLVPTGVLHPSGREVDRMMNHMEDVQFLENGWFDYPASENQADWFNLGGFSKVQPYYTRNAEVYAMRDDVKPFLRSYFNTLAAMVSPEVMTFWEHFHNAGAYDKTHETGYFLHQTRTMLVQERGNELRLAPFIPVDWLGSGKRLKVVNAPTAFGPVSYELRSRLNESHLDATIDPPSRGAADVVLRLRTPDGVKIRSVLLDGKRYRHFNSKAGTVWLPNPSRSLNLRICY